MSVSWIFEKKKAPERERERERVGWWWGERRAGRSDSGGVCDSTERLAWCWLRLRSTCGATFQRSPPLSPLPLPEPLPNRSRTALEPLWSGSATSVSPWCAGGSANPFSCRTPFRACQWNAVLLIALARVLQRWLAWLLNPALRNVLLIGLARVLQR